MKTIAIAMIFLLLAVAVIAADESAEKIRASKDDTNQTNQTFGQCVSEAAKARNTCYDTAKSDKETCLSTVVDDKNAAKKCNADYKQEKKSCKAEFKAAKDDCKRLKHNFFDTMKASFA